MRTALVALTLLALAGLGCATLGAGSTAAPEYLNCPVSGGQMRVGPETPRSTYGGKTYYFCCAGCKEAFDKDPGHYSRP